MEEDVTSLGPHAVSAPGNDYNFRVHLRHGTTTRTLAESAQRYPDRFQAASADVDHLREIAEPACATSAATCPPKYPSAAALDGRHRRGHPGHPRPGPATAARARSTWLQVLTKLKNRGLDDVLMLCNGFKGLPDAVEAVCPRAVEQT